MRCEKPGLLGSPPGDHDTHQAEELVSKRNVESRLDGRGRRPRRRIILLSCLASGTQEKPPVRIKGRQSGREDGHSARRVLVGHKYCPATILASEPAIPPNESLACLALGFPPLVCPVAAIPTRHDGQ